MMSTGTNKLLLVLTILALVMTPVRGAWSMSMPAPAEDSPSHCDQMDMQHSEHMAGTDAPDSSNTDEHQCKDGCDGSCCNGNCNACAYTVISLPGSVNTPPDLQNTRWTGSLAAVYPHRSLTPPLRPPASS